MRDEVKRISKLVAEGKLSPEDAADLIEGFYASERPSASDAGSSPPPPPPPGATQGADSEPDSAGATPPKDAFAAFIESVERMTKEGRDSVNWSEVSQQAKQSAVKGYEALKAGIEEISKGKINLGWISGHEIKEVSLPLNVPAGKTLKIENHAGSVKVFGGVGEAGNVVARARFKAATLEEARQKAEAYMFVIEESDHVVLIRQPDVTGLHVDLEAMMPGIAAVEIRAQTGDIKVIDTGSSCRIHNRTGDIQLKGLNGPIEISAETGNISVENSETPSLSIENKTGDITLTEIRGNVNARTATGQVKITGGAGKVISVESVSGDVHVDCQEPIVGTLNVRTVNGDAKISLPDGNDCRVSLSTLRGVATCNMPLVDEARTDQRVTGRLGNGMGSLDVSAVTGDVSVELRDSV